MFGFMVTADGGLTTAGYVITVIAGIILFFLAIYFAGKNSDKKKLTTRQLVFCAVAIALAFITSYLKIFKLPWGGSVTLCSMLFIVLIANWYGSELVLWLGLLTESCSLSRSLIYFHFFRCAVITYLHLRHLDWQDYLQNRVMDF